MAGGTKRRLAVYDFDDTLVSSRGSVSVDHGEGDITILDSSSFAYFKPTPGDKIDFGDFNDITRPRLIKKGMDAIKKDASDPNTRVVVLTARPKGSAPAISKFFDHLGIKGVEAVALQSSRPEDKARWVEEASEGAEEVFFMDDSKKNTAAVEGLAARVKAKVITNNPPHPTDSDYDGDTISKVFKSDSPTKAILEVEDKAQEDGKEEGRRVRKPSEWWTNQSPEFQRQYCKNHPESQYCKGIAASRRCRNAKVVDASVKDIVDKIVRKIRDSALIQRLTDKVMRFFQTRNPANDLSPDEVAAIYRSEDYGDDFDLTGGRELEIGWTNHAKYRSDLRGIDPSRVNEAIRDFADTHRRVDKKLNLLKPGVGKVVVDMKQNSDPERAAVITVMASAGPAKELQDRADKVKSQRVKKYVKEGLLPKVKQLGDAAWYWLERLEVDFKKLRPEGLMEGFTDEDFDELFFVITGDKRK